LSTSCVRGFGHPHDQADEHCSNGQMDLEVVPERRWTMGKPPQG
jgi:hypothetical protein